MTKIKLTMKKSLTLLSAVFIFLLAACSGSDTYRGSWKALDENGAKYELLFDANTFSIKDSTRKSKRFEYTQNSVNVTNSVETYGIKLQDGRALEINFPKADDESVGIIVDGNGKPIYTIGRNDYVQYDDLYELL